MRKYLIILILLLCLPIFAKGNRQDDPSYQVDHNRTKNFSPTYHYLQENIDRVSDIFNGLNFHEFYINEDLNDVTSKLIFGRTTGGNGEISYDGNSIAFNKLNIIKILSGTTVGLWENSDYNGSSTGNMAYYGFGASSGETYFEIQSTKLGNTQYAPLGLQVYGGQLGVGTATFIGSEKLRVNGNEYLDGELQIASTGKVISGSKALTDGSATGIFEVAIPSNASAGGTVSYSVKVFDGTNLQNHTGIISFAGVNKGGTVTSDIDEVYLAASETSKLTAGTLSDSWTITDGAGKITINLNANTSLTPTSFVLFYTITLNGNEVVAKL